jgi:hypothetical protein
MDSTPLGAATTAVTTLTAAAWSDLAMPLLASVGRRRGQYGAGAREMMVGAEGIEPTTAGV